LAHEVAHLLIHRDVFSQLKFSTVREWKKVACSIPEDEYGWIEWQAYALAGLILVPACPLRDLFADATEKAMRAGVDLRDVDESARKIVASSLGKHFEVSADVILKRLEKERLWGS